jgi:hypothetical protein
MRFVHTTLAVAGLLLALPAFAAPAGASASACTQGQGKQVCCKAYVADHCAQPTCCESGNQAFFSARACGGCSVRAVKAASSCSVPAGAAIAAGGCAQSGGAVLASKSGNRSFFSSAACSGQKVAACGPAGCSSAASACGTARVASAAKAGSCCGAKAHQ